MSLYISTKTASSKLADSPITQAITFLATTIAIKTQHGHIPSGPSLDITFLLPGELDKPDFIGMQMGGYSEKGNTLFFEISVPEHITYSNKVKQYMAAVMQDVIINANEYFTENNVSFDLERWKLLVIKLTSNVDDLVANEKLSVGK